MAFWAAAIPAIASIAGGLFQGQAGKEAADKSAEGSQAQIDLARQIYGDQRALSAPGYYGGGNAFNLLSAQYGLPAQDFGAAFNGGGGFGGNGLLFGGGAGGSSGAPATGGMSSNQTGPMPTFSGSWLGDHDPSLINAFSNGGDGLKSWVQGGGSVIPATLNKLTGVNPLDPLNIFGKEKYDRVEAYNAPQQSNWQQYFQDNPDVAAEWNSLPTDFRAKQFGGDPNSYAYWHADNASQGTFGAGDNRTLYAAGAGPQPQGTGQTGTAQQVNGLATPYNGAPVTSDPLATFMESPDAKLAQNQFLNFDTPEVEGAFSAGGKVLSGAQKKALSDYGASRLTNAYGNYGNGLRALAGANQVATSQINNASTNFGNTAGTALGNQANYRASGYAAQANGLANGMSGAISGLSDYYGKNGGWG
jgi:hypothetical protein